MSIIENGRELSRSEVESFLRGQTFTLDFDQVISNTGEAVLREFNRRFDTELDWTSDIRGWYPLTPILQEMGYKETKARQIEVDIWNDESVLLGANGVYGAFNFVSSIIVNTFGKVHFITSRPSSLREVTLQWLDRWKISWNPFFMKEQVWLRRDDEETGEDFKVNRIKMIQAALKRPIIHVEDSSQTAKAIVESVPRAHVVLLQTTEDLANISFPERITLMDRMPQGQILNYVHALFLQEGFWKKLGVNGS